MACLKKQEIQILALAGWYGMMSAMVKSPLSISALFLGLVQGVFALCNVNYLTS